MRSSPREEFFTTPSLYETSSPCADIEPTLRVADERDSSVFLERPMRRSRWKKVAWALRTVMEIPAVQVERLGWVAAAPVPEEIPSSALADGPAAMERVPQ
jgi:hypothetical protein